MRHIEVWNVTRRAVLGKKVRVLTSLLERAIGLLGTTELRPDEGVYLSPCKSIHTYFMHYPIDVLFLDGKGMVLHEDTYLPFRISGWYTGSKGALELPHGTLMLTGTRVGDHIEMKGLN
jgi:uncharacterized membrane protein (UPF0127 family)